jgi:LuxR family maltose regulon positive regulatory protein
MEWIPDSFWLASRLRALRIATGDTQAVQESLEARSRSSESSSSTLQLAEEILRGRLWLAQGKVKDARELFARLLPTAQEYLHQYAALELQVLLALAHAASKQEQQAHYWLRQALLQSVHEGFIRLFLNMGKPMISLLGSTLPTLQHDTMLRSYVQAILREAQLEADSPHMEQARASRPTGGGWGNMGLFEPLSTQEERVLRLLAAGWNNQEIARELIVSVNTVKYHVKHLYQKLGVSNRLQASEAARQLRLSPLTPRLPTASQRDELP